MTTKSIANEDLQVNFDIQTSPPAVPPDPPSDLQYTGDQGIDLVKIVPTKSTTCKANSKFVCTTGITLTWTVIGCPFTSALYTFVSGTGTITPSATKCKADNALVLRKDDIGTCIGSWMLTNPPNTVQACACNLKISNAGQTEVKGQ